MYCWLSHVICRSDIKLWSLDSFSLGLLDHPFVGVAHESEEGWPDNSHSLVAFYSKCWSLRRTACQCYKPMYLPSIFLNARILRHMTNAVKIPFQFMCSSRGACLDCILSGVQVTAELGFILL